MDWNNDPEDAPVCRIFSERVRVAKKVHPCNCEKGRAITVGTAYVSVVGTLDGEFFISRHCKNPKPGCGYYLPKSEGGYDPELE